MVVCTGVTPGLQATPKDRRRPLRGQKASVRHEGVIGVPFFALTRF